MYYHFWLWTRRSARGHHLKIATFPRFQPLAERHGCTFAPIHGDEDLMMSLLTGDGVTGMAYLRGLSTVIYTFRGT